MQLPNEDSLPTIFPIVNTAEPAPIDKIAPALVAFHGEIQNPGFDSVNPHFHSKYASLATCLATVRPILSKHGLCIMQHVINDGDRYGCETVLLHTSGQRFVSTITMKPKDPTNPQACKTCVTYCRRTALDGILAIAGEEDDDGNLASKAVPVDPKKAVREVPNGEEMSVKQEFHSLLKSYTGVEKPENLPAFARLIVKRAYKDSGKKAPTGIKPGVRLSNPQIAAGLEWIKEKKADDVPFKDLFTTEEVGHELGQV